MSVCVCLYAAYKCVCAYVCAHACFCVCIHVSVYMSVWVNMPGRGGECLCVGVNVCVEGVYMPLCGCVYVSVCAHACVFRANCPWETLCICKLPPSLMQLQACTLNKFKEHWKMDVRF